MAQITKEALLEKLFQNDYEELKGKRLRLTREGSGKRSLYGTCYQQIGYLYL